MVTEILCSTLECALVDCCLVTFSRATAETTNQKHGRDLCSATSSRRAGRLVSVDQLVSFLAILFVYFSSINYVNLTMKIYILYNGLQLLFIYLFSAILKFNNVFRKVPSKMLLSHVMNRLRVTSDVECVLRCQRYPGCKSINFVRSASGSKGHHSLCELNRRTNGVLTENLRTEELSCYYDVVI